MEETERTSVEETATEGRAGTVRAVQGDRTVQINQVGTPSLGDGSSIEVGSAAVNGRVAIKMATATRSFFVETALGSEL